ncbi:MAG: replicative DNA helicase [Elusimicrobia bacterium GWA2_69_24]|nr:MAG: replicative DNA helicase [Elusimicrobia bacterium GWA2_69_24]HBL17337.1 replicative DNA helicase [Elusimicrobiota bacterium]
MPDSPHIPPQALEAEMAVLGSMLIEAEAVEKAVDLLEEKDFYRDAHRKIFAAILGLCENGQAIDCVTVGEELKRLKQIGEIGGASYLAELTQKVSTAGYVDHYAKIVRERSVLRELIRVSTDIVGQCYGTEKEADALLDEAQQNILAVAQKQTVSSFYRAKELSHEVIERIELLHQRKQEVIGVPTGFKRIDKMTAGLQRGDLILLAARPSQGKTALALNIAANVALKDPAIPVAVFSMEMSRSSIMTRLISSEARVNQQDVRTGYFKRSSWTDLTNAAARISEAPLFIDDGTSLSVLEVRSRSRRLANELRAEGKELGLIVIDYLQLMRGSSRRSESRQQEVSEISRGLKALARDMNLPVIALSQLSRRPEDKGRSDSRPQLSDLRESGALEQDADVVAFIYREGYYKRDDPSVQNKAELIISKQRNGPVGTVELVFRHELTRFESATDVPEPGDEGSGQGEFES